jgi:hypothetical protein
MRLLETFLMPKRLLKRNPAVHYLSELSQLLITRPPA